MNIMKFVPNKVTTIVVRQALIVQKNSPSLLFAAGVIGVVATVVIASRATLKLEEVLESTQKDLFRAKELHDSNHEKYSDQDYKNDVAIVYIHSAVSVVKLYGPAVVVGIASIAFLVGSHQILTRRNAGLMAAYTALEKGFNEYRQRVIAEVGPDKERELRYGSEIQEFVDDKGKIKKKLVVGTGVPSIYARFFDECSRQWQKEPNYNLVFLRAQQSYANNLLQSRGHVMLNDVYDQLDIPRSSAGAIVGWMWKKDGDNFIDFGIFDPANSEARDFVNGRNFGAILLDFNVDGVVYKLIERE